MAKAKTEGKVDPKRPAAKKATTEDGAVVPPPTIDKEPSPRPIFTPAPLSLLQPWHRIARGELGIREMDGEADNPRILEYHATTKLKATDDEVPWCSSFASWVMLQASLRSTKSAAAISWASYGVKLLEPRLGCLVVLKRKGGHHVGFLEALDGNTVWILGGNQSDAVTIAPRDEEDVIEYRWPDFVTMKD